MAARSPPPTHVAAGRATAHRNSVLAAIGLVSTPSSKGVDDWVGRNRLILSLPRKAHMNDSEQTPSTAAQPDATILAARTPPTPAASPDGAGRCPACGSIGRSFDDDPEFEERPEAWEGWEPPDTIPPPPPGADYLHARLPEKVDRPVLLAVDVLERDGTVTNTEVGATLVGIGRDDVEVQQALAAPLADGRWMLSEIRTDKTQLVRVYSSLPDLARAMWEESASEVSLFGLLAQLGLIRFDLEAASAVGERFAGTGAEPVAAAAAVAKPQNARSRA